MSDTTVLNDRSRTLTEAIQKLSAELAAVGERTNSGTLLGLAIAHEIGHLLLSDHSHSRTGIMRARLDRQDLRLAAFGDLMFTPQQAQSIRAEIARRMLKQGSEGR